MIYFDEAGNSGDNLLDKTQPVYILLSHNYTNEEVADILSPVIKSTNAKELHFKTLKKYPKSLNALSEALSNPLINDCRIFHYVAHKEFMIVIQMVDRLLEHVLYNQGVDIYHNGFNVATANILSVMGNNIWDRTLFRKLCEAFVLWFRSKEKSNGDKFYKVALELNKTIKNEDQQILMQLILESRESTEEILESVGKYTLDPTLSCFNSHCQFWANKYNSPFDITFDDSKQIEYWRDMIQFLTDYPPTAEVGYGSRKHKYPLLINSLQTSDSQKHLGIQLADLFGSSLYYYYKNLHNQTLDSFSQLIEDRLLKNTSRMFMWPGTEVTPEALGMKDSAGTNALDFIADNAMKNIEIFERATKRPIAKNNT